MDLNALGSYPAGSRPFTWIALSSKPSFSDILFTPSAKRSPIPCLFAIISNSFITTSESPNLIGKDVFNLPASYASIAKATTLPALIVSIPSLSHRSFILTRSSNLSISQRPAKENIVSYSGPSILSPA